MDVQVEMRLVARRLPQRQGMGTARPDLIQTVRRDAARQARP